MIEAGAVVFPRDRGSQLHEFGFVEPLTQAGKERVGNFHWRPRHCIRIFKHETLKCREIEIDAIVRQVGDLLAADAYFSADGRTDINSKRTTHQRRHAQLGKPLQLVIDELAAGL
jgi:hypothetical protein